MVKLKDTKSKDLIHLSEFLFKEYTEDLFIKQDKRYQEMCRSVVLHEAEEQYGLKLSVTETDYVISLVSLQIKKTIKS